MAGGGLKKHPGWKRGYLTRSRSSGCADEMPVHGTRGPHGACRVERDWPPASSLLCSMRLNSRCSLPGRGPSPPAAASPGPPSADWRTWGSLWEALGKARGCGVALARQLAAAMSCPGLFHPSMGRWTLHSKAARATRKWLQLLSFSAPERRCWGGAALSIPPAVAPSPSLGFQGRAFPGSPPRIKY